MSAVVFGMVMGGALTFVTIVVVLLTATTIVALVQSLGLSSFLLFAAVGAGALAGGYWASVKHTQGTPE